MSSRFWLMRKHINSLMQDELRKLPFFCWECITLIIEKDNIETNVNLVIKDQFTMTKFIEFMLVSLESIDGYRGTANNYLEFLVKTKQIKLSSEKLKKKTLEELYCRAFGKFNLMRFRMKISYHALVQ